MEAHRAIQRVDEFELLKFLQSFQSELEDYISRRIPPKLRRVISVDDILQETWFCSFRGVPHFVVKGPSALKGWILSITNHRIVDAIKTAKRLKRAGNGQATYSEQHLDRSYLNLFSMIAAVQSSPSTRVARVETIQTVREALDHLSDERKQAIHMRHIDGLAIAEIASRMNKTKAAVHSLLFNGLIQMRHWMGRADRFFSDAQSVATLMKAANETSQ